MPSPRFTRTLSASSTSSTDADWDTSLVLSPSHDQNDNGRQTPRNSVLFPQGETTPNRPTTDPPTTTDAQPTGTRGQRTLSDLLKLHAQKGTTCAFTQEEALRVGDVLGQWINSSSSPYEPDTDDFFLSPSPSKDDLFIPSKRTANADMDGGRQRGMSVGGALSSGGSSSSS